MRTDTVSTARALVSPDNTLTHTHTCALSLPPPSPTTCAFSLLLCSPRAHLHCVFHVPLSFKVTAPLLADKSAVMWQFLPPLVLTVVCIGLGFFLNSLIWTAGVCNNTVIFDSSSSSRASSPTRYPTKYPTSTSNTNYPTPDTHSQFSTTFPTALGQVDLGNGWNVCWLTYLLALPFQIGFVFIVLPMWWSVRCRLTISLFLSIVFH